MDIEKTIQFLLDQQARFDARQAEFDARQKRLDERQALFVEQSNERMTRAEHFMLRIAAAQERTNAIVATLAERHVALEEKLAVLAVSHESLADAHKATEEALHRLIANVDRHIANHR